MSIKFTVANGANPVPYKRTTQKKKWVDSDYKRYQQWGDIIIASFVEATGQFPYNILKPQTRYRVDVMIYYKNKKHGDSDNVAKGVNDSLFKSPKLAKSKLDDKYVSGSYDFAYDADNPRVEVEIIELESLI